MQTISEVLDSALLEAWELLFTMLVYIHFAGARIVIVAFSLIVFIAFDLFPLLQKIDFIQSRNDIVYS